VIGEYGIWTRGFRYLTCFLTVSWLLMPLVPLAIWSFAQGWFFPDIVPRAWTLRAWEYAASDTSGVFDSLWLTIGISMAAAGLSILVGVPAGRALGMYRFRGKELVELMILAPIIVPGIAVVLGIHSIFITLGSPIP